MNRPQLSTCYVFLFAFWLLAGTTSALAQISLSDTILHLKTGTRPIINLVVRNSSSEILYISSVAEVVLEPGNPKSTSVIDEDLLVSPKKFSVAGNGERTVRILLKKQPAEIEKLYRLSFIPQDQAFEGAGETKIFKNRKISVKVLSGMGALLFVDALRPNPQLSWTREKGAIVFHNSGNQHVRLMFGKQCMPGADPENCKGIDAKRVYAAQTVRIEVDDQSTVTFFRRDNLDGTGKEITIAPLGSTALTNDNNGVAAPSAE